MCLKRISPEHFAQRLFGFSFRVPVSPAAALFSSKANNSGGGGGSTPISILRSLAPTATDYSAVPKRIAKFRSALKDEFIHAASDIRKRFK